MASPQPLLPITVDYAMTDYSPLPRPAQSVDSFRGVSPCSSSSFRVSYPPAQTPPHSPIACPRQKRHKRQKQYNVGIQVYPVVTHRATQTDPPRSRTPSPQRFQDFVPRFPSVVNADMSDYVELPLAPRAPPKLTRTQKRNLRRRRNCVLIK
jgi:hypothetical protein